MPNTITLNCWIQGDDFEHIFLIDIAKTKTIAALKKAIKEEQKPAFDHIRSDTLVLWKVSIPANDNLAERLLMLNLDSVEPLAPLTRLSSLFEDKPEDDQHINVVIRSPLSVPRSSMDTKLLQLNCLVLGEPNTRIFPVKIGWTETVGALKDAIKEKNPHEFQHIDAKTLDLWMVSIPADDSLQANIEKLKSDSPEPLSAVEEVGEVFSLGLMKKHVHIVVKPPADLRTQPPPSKASKLDTIDELMATLTFSHLEAAQNDVVEGVRKAPSPSEAAAISGFRQEQDERPIWNGRPSMNRGIPIQLYHPSFAKFLRVTREGTGEIDLNAEDYSATHSLFHVSAALYETEQKRLEKTRVFLEKAIRRAIPAMDISCMRADGACQGLCGNLHALMANEEAKNEVGTGGCDPAHQCSMGYRLYYARDEMKPIRDRCCCPTFLIAVAGPWMCILGAVFVDHVVVQELTDFIWIGGHPYNDEKLESVTRMLAALGEGITELEVFYKELNLNSPQDPQRFFPFIRQYSVGERIIRFSYQAYLTPNTPNTPAKAIFLATTENEDGHGFCRRIVVKFVQKYNARAHRLLEAVHHAPGLLYCSKEDTQFPDLGGLIMVVMEYVDGKSAHQRYGNQPLTRPIYDQVENAIAILHAADIVFADLRQPNIMITKDEVVLLVDFDWCGIHEENTYPLSLNDARDTSTSIDWHPDVKRGGRMLKEHDIFRLSKLKPSS